MVWNNYIIRKIKLKSCLNLSKSAKKVQKREKDKKRGRNTKKPAACNTQTARKRLEVENYADDCGEQDKNNGMPLFCRLYEIGKNQDDNGQ